MAWFRLLPITVMVTDTSGAWLMLPPAMATLILPGELNHPLVKRGHVRHFRRRRQGQGYQSVAGYAAHRGDIAEVDRQRFPAQVLPGGRLQGKMDVLHHGVDGGKLDGIGAFPGGGIVADADKEVRGALSIRASAIILCEEVDKPELPDFRDFHA